MAWTTGMELHTLPHHEFTHCLLMSTTCLSTVHLPYRQCIKTSTCTATASTGCPTHGLLPPAPLLPSHLLPVLPHQYGFVDLPVAVGVPEHVDQEVSLSLVPYGIAMDSVEVKGAIRVTSSSNLGGKACKKHSQMGPDQAQPQWWLHLPYNTLHTTHCGQGMNICVQKMGQTDHARHHHQLHTTSSLLTRRCPLCRAQESDAARRAGTSSKACVRHMSCVQHITPPLPLLTSRSSL